MQTTYKKQTSSITQTINNKKKVQHQTRRWLFGGRQRAAILADFVSRGWKPGGEKRPHGFPEPGEKVD